MLVQGIVYGKPVNQGITQLKPKRNLKSFAEEESRKKIGRSKSTQFILGEPGEPKSPPIVSTSIGSELPISKDGSSQVTFFTSGIILRRSLQIVLTILHYALVRSNWIVALMRDHSGSKMQQNADFWTRLPSWLHGIFMLQAEQSVAENLSIEGEAWTIEEEDGIYGHNQTCYPIEFVSVWDIDHGLLCRIRLTSTLRSF